MLSGAMTETGRVRSDELVYLSRDPANAETPLDRLVGAITPAGRHYIRDHFARPTPPQTLVVDGAVRTPLELAHADLRRLPQRSLVVTLECAGNGRAFLDPPVPGEQWRSGAVGTAEWTGVSLGAVLEMAEPLATAVDLVCVGADAGTPADVGTRIAYERSLSLADALREDVLLAYAMNGEDLPREHGAPLRLVVPGWYGMASVKWLARLRLIERRFDGFFQARRYLVDDRPLREIAPRAIISRPRDGERIPARPFVVAGYAWSGRGAVSRVEISSDDGASWHDAKLGPALSPYAWRQWDASVTPPAKGPLVLLARATTPSGITQPTTQVRSALGYENNAARPVRVEIL